MCELNDLDLNWMVTDFAGNAMAVFSDESDADNWAQNITHPAAAAIVVDRNREFVRKDKKGGVRQ